MLKPEVSSDNSNNYLEKEMLDFRLSDGIKTNYTNVCQMYVFVAGKLSKCLS